MQVLGHWVLEQVGQCVSRLGAQQGPGNAVSLLGLDGGEGYDVQLPARVT